MKLAPVLSVLFALPPAAAAETFYPDPEPPAVRAEASEQERPWFFNKVGGPAFWKVSRGSRAVKVLVCDTGVDAAHPDLRGNVGPGKNFADGSANTAPSGNGHGTRVAGVIGARGGHDGYGAFGLNYEVTIVPGKISNAADGAADHRNTAACVRWGAEQGIRIVNLSFSGAIDNPDVQAAAGELYRRGGLLIMSAGNEGARKDFPDDPYMLAVGATDMIDWKSPWSNTGPYVDISAPGSNIYTTEAGGGYITTRGTSMAAPMVSGAAALLISVRPDLTAGELRDLLLKSIVDLGTPGRDEAYGEGRVDLGLGDFTPPSQDKAAAEVLLRAGAYDLALKSDAYANFAAAVKKLNGIWASLPGSPHGQHTRPMAELWQAYRAALARY